MARVLYLSLTNLASVYTGLGKPKVSIDFSNTKHLFLFMGANGSGKTSIMSCIHPFAYNYGSNINNSDFIREGHDGEKIIKIECNNHLYDIRHVYNRKKDTIAVQSFIKEDGVDLNPNGTVTTFKDVIYNKLGITETFLTLLSLGNRVDGFVEYTASERKTFISKIFLELNICAEKYKIMVQKERAKKAVLLNVTNKLAKYKNTDRNELKNRYDSVSSGITQLNNSLASINSSIGGIEANLLMKREASVEASKLSSQILSLTSDVSLLTANLYHSEYNLSKLKEISDETQTEINNITLKIENHKSKEAHEVELIDVLTVNRDTITVALSKFNSDNEAIKDTLDRLSTVRDELKELKEKSTDEISKYAESIKLSYGELIKAEIYLKELERICCKVVSNVDSMKTLIDIFKKRNHITAEDIEKIEGDINYEKARYQALITLAKDVLISAKDIKTDKCSKKCPYKAFYDAYITVRENHTNLDETFDSISETTSLLSDKKESMVGLVELNSFIKERKLYQLPEDIFNPKIYLLQYIDSGRCANHGLLARVIEAFEDREELAELMKEEKELSKRYTSLTSENNGIKDNLEASLNDINQKIKTSNEIIISCKEEIEKLEMIRHELEDKLSYYLSDIEKRVRIDEINKEIKSIKDRYSKYADVLKEIEYLEHKLSELDLDKRNTEDKLRNLEASKESLSLAISEITSLEKDEIVLRRDYDNIKMIRDALSPTKGIPVEFIDYYFRSKMINDMNTLLDSVYGGNLRLVKEGLIINDSVFTIPYRKDNTIVSDISHASDGEQAIIKLVFSLVLMKASICSDINKDTYNTVLLDEMDTSLDHNSRGKFLDLLEAFRHVIRADQIFCISHNNMLDNYPLEVFLTSDMDVSYLTKADITKLY